MRSRADVVLCLDDGQGACAFSCTLAAHTGCWANWVSLLTGRYTSAHEAKKPGDPIRTWTNLPDLFRGAGYACRAYGVDALPFLWEHCPASAVPIQGETPELAVVSGRVARPSAWVLHLNMPAQDADALDGLRVLTGVTPPEGIFLPKRFAHPVSVVDLLPTLCRMLDQPIPPDVQGRSLIPLLENEALAKRELSYAYAETEDGSLIWNGQQGVLATPDGLFRLEEGLHRGAEETDEAMLAALGAAMLRAQDTLPIPQRRYRVKRHPDNLWFDASYRQTTDPGVIGRAQPKEQHHRVPPVVWEG